MRVVASLALPLLVAACGARTGVPLEETLFVAGPSGNGSGASSGAGNGTAGKGGASNAGAGGATAGTGGSAGAGAAGSGGASGGGAGGASGGSAGAGGASGAGCSTLTVTGAPRTLQAIGGGENHLGVLLARPTGSSSVVVAMPAMPLESPMGAAAHLRLLGFTPWGAWPQQLGPGTQGSFVVGAHQVQMGPGDLPGSLAFAYPSAPSPPAPAPQGLFLAPAGTPGGQPGTGVISLGSGAATEVARALGNLLGGQLVLRESGAGSFATLDVVLATSKKGVQTWFEAGCATAPMRAAATRLPDGRALVAFSSGRVFGDCMLDDGVTGPPSRVHVATLDGTTAGPAPLAPSLAEAAGDFVVDVQAAPHPSGAWVVHHFAGANAEVQPPPLATRLATDGTTQAGGELLPSGGGLLGEMTIAAFGDRLVTAHVDIAGPGPGTMIVTVWSDTLVPLASASLEPPTGGFFTTEHALATDPESGQILLGWTQQGTPCPECGGGTVTKGFVARLGCGPLSGIGSGRDDGRDDGRDNGVRSSGADFTKSLSSAMP